MSDSLLRKFVNQTVMRRPGLCGNVSQQNFGQNYRKRQLINPFEIVENVLRTRVSRKKFLGHLRANLLP